jgi:hypothetical protein
MKAKSYKPSNKMYLGDEAKNPARMGTIPSPANGKSGVKKSAPRSTAAQRILGENNV